MAFNRELSQFAAYLSLDAASNYIGITTAQSTTNVGIGKTNPTSKLDVVGDARISGVTTSVGGFVGALTGNVTGNVTGNLTGNVTGNADTASGLQTARTISLTGDVAGSVSFDGSSNVSIAATIQPNSVALGGDTTGNYVATVADAGSSDIVVSGSGSETAAVTLGLSTTGVTAGSYGSATQIPTFTVDSRGRLTAAGTASVGAALTVTGNSGTETINFLNENLSIVGAAGSVSTSAANNTITVDLVNTTVTPGSYGSSTEIPTFTVDAKGRLTAAGTASVGAALTVAGDSGTETINFLSENLTIAGGTNLTSSASANTVTVNLDDNISLTSVVASGIVTAAQFKTGATGSAIGINTNTISGPATITIDPAGVGDNTGTVVIAGNLQVDGTTTTVNSTTVTVDDKNIQIADGAANDAAADGAGFTVTSGEGNKTFQFEATGDNFGSSENMNLASGKVYKINNTEVLSASTLGSGVVNSSLTSVGTLTNLNVSGVTTSSGGFVGNLTGTASTATAAGTAYGLTGTPNITVGAVNASSINVSGLSTFVGNAVFQGHASFGDQDEIRLGASDDLKIVHSASGAPFDRNRIISSVTSSNVIGLAVESAGGAIAFTKGDVIFGSGENIAKFIPDGAVELYHDNSKKFETTGYGATVFGTLQSQQINVSGVTTSSGGFVGNLTGTATTATKAVQLQTGRTIALSGDVVGQVLFDGTSNVSIAATIQPNSVALGGDTTGNYVATVADSGSSDIVVSGSGSETAAVTLGLSTTGVTAGTYGSSTQIPTFTVDSRGRLTAAGSASVGAALTVAGDSGTETINFLNENLTIAGGTNLTSSASSNTVTINLDDNISLTSVVASGVVTAAQFKTGAAGSAIGISTDTISGPAIINIDPAGLGDNTGTVVIKGNLQIDGTTTTVNSTTVTVDDKNLLLASGAANDAAADGGGITIESGDGNKTWNWVDATDSWTSSEHIDIASSKAYKVNGASVLTGTTLGSGVLNSSLTSVGTLTKLDVGDVNATGMSTVTNLKISGYVSVGNTHGTSGQVLASVGAGVTWKSLADVLPQARTTQTNTATSGQTAFTFAYNVNYLDVFINGVKLSSSEYTATNGADITLNEAAFAGDIVEFVSYATIGAGSGTVSSFNDLSDVTLTSNTTGQTVVYNGSQWVNSSNLNVGIVTATTFDGDLTGNVTGNVVGDLTGEVNAAAFDTNVSGVVVTGVATATSFSTGSGNIGITTNTISGPATITIDPAAVGDNTGTVVIAGNLQVDGTTTTINSTVMTVDDLNITLASGAANASAANGAGITVDGASATFNYASSGDKWVSNKDVEAPNFNTTSDRNLKDNIRQVEGASELVSKLEGVHFTWKENGKETIGVIAQQIEEHLPQLVQTGDTHKTVNYNGLIGVLIEAVKEQGAQIAALQAEIEELKK